jgi:hypothetical protein
VFSPLIVHPISIHLTDSFGFLIDPIPKVPVPSSSETNNHMNEEFNLEDRILCDDDTCIGLVGDNGLCKVCGRKYQGSLPLPKGDNGEESTSEPDDPIERIDPLLKATVDDTDDRIPCIDDLCIGIIGADGKCGTCGKSA